MSGGARNPHVVLLTTTDVNAGRQAEISRLIASIEAFRAARPAISVSFHLFIQRAADLATARALYGVPDWVELSVSPELHSLSSARNRLIRAMLANAELGDDGILAFPDDDCWYPAGTMEGIVDAFQADPALDLWFCRYGMDARWDTSARPVAPNFRQLVSYLASNTMAVRGTLFKRIGGFDETLGLGTPARGGEDTDFGLRAAQRARGIAFTDARLIGHRDFSPALRARYYAGSLAVIRRYAGTMPGSTWALLRKLSVGVTFVLLREMRPKDLAEAFQLVRADRRRRKDRASQPGVPALDIPGMEA